MKPVTFALLALFMLTGCNKGPRFDKITIQVHEPNPLDEMAPTLHFGRFVAQDQTLLDLVAFAYQVQPTQVSGPDSLRQASYNVFADLPKDADPKQLPAMLQAALAERFKLVTKRESSKREFFVLKVAPGGPRFKEAPADPEWDPGQPSGFRFSILLRNTMPRWTQVLSQFVKRPVLDQTGLKGKYTANLGINLSDNPGEEARRELDAQLGLSLEPREEILDEIVVEKAESPTTDK